ncbi:MAG: AMP-binding protein [Acidobacteriaceae bacterium]
MRPHLATLVDDFQRHGKQIAVVDRPGNRRVTTSYAALADLAGRFSALLAGKKIAPGERVVLWGANTAEWVAAFFGCVLRGVLVVPLDAHGGAEFAARVIDDVTPRMIVGDAALLTQAPLPTQIPRLVLGGLRQQLPAAPLLTPDPALGLDTPLQVLFTSGTTSDPKGVVHTHGNVLASLQVLEEEIAKYRKYERPFHPLRFLHTLPLSHVFGQFMGLWVPPLLAAEVHYEDNLLATHLVERIHDERISVAAVVPRVLELLRRELEATTPHLPARLAAAQGERAWKRWWRFRDLHNRFGWKFWAFVCGGAALPAELGSFWDRLAFAVVQGYGMTETTALVTLVHPFHAALGTVGRPLPGREVRVAEDGEVLVRGAMVARSQWRKGRMEPLLSSTTAGPNAWLATGDLAALDSGGQMRFLGRKGDVIVTAAGVNIHPTDIETLLCQQPGVRDAAVVGWDGLQGPEAVAAVLFHGDDAALQRAVQAANQSLPEFQRLRHALRWPQVEFPRTTLGKLLRREVAAWVAGQLGPSLHPAASEQGAQTPALGQPTDPLLRILGAVTGLPAPHAEDAADLALDLHLDSLARVQLAMALEQHFGVAMPDAALATAQTLGDLRRMVSLQVETSTSSVVAGAAGKAQLPTEEAAGPVTPKSIDLPCPHWPWTAPVQMLRVLFLEAVLRPLVSLLAHPRVLSVPAGRPSNPGRIAPALYIANHVTALDVPLVLYALPAPVRRRMAIAMSAEILADWRRGRNQDNWFFNLLAPVEYWLVTALFNIFPLPAGAGLRQSFQHAGKALDHGFNVLVFPEGQRTKDGRLQPFRPGTGLLAQQSRASVVPLALRGLWQAKQQGRWLRPPGLEIAVGTPIIPSDGETTPALTQRLEDAVRQLL